MWILILTLVVTTGTGTSGHTVAVPEFKTRKVCQEAADAWLSDKLVASGARTAVCVPTSEAAKTRVE